MVMSLWPHFFGGPRCALPKKREPRKLRFLLKRNIFIYQQTQKAFKLSLGYR